MNEDIYVKLCERLNQNTVKMPPVAAVLDFLRELFTEEQAKLAAEIPLGAHTLKSLAEQLNRDRNPLEKMLETMADEGIMFVAETENNEKEYSVPPFAPGILELQYLKGEKTERAIKRYHMMAKMHEELGTMTNELYKDVEAANKRIGSPGLRTLAIEEELPSNTEIATWEKISEIIAREDSFAVGSCACRLGTKVKGDPCKIDGVPMEACVYFGKVADYMVDRNFGKRFSKGRSSGLLKRILKFLELRTKSKARAPENITKQRIPKLISSIGLNRRTDRVAMAYDKQSDGMMVSVTQKDGQRPGVVRSRRCHVFASPMRPRGLGHPGGMVLERPCCA